MNDTCICDNAPKVWRLTGVTRTLRLRIFNPDGTPLDLTGRTVAVTIARDNSEFSYAPGFVIEGDDGNVVKFEWPADKQGAGDYTINVTTTDGSGNVDRVNWHGPTGIRLVDFSFMVRGEDALGVTSEANIGLDGTFTMNGAGMSAYDEWLVEGHTGTPEDFIAWLRQPAEDAATEAVATVDAKMAEVDADMAAVEATAAADHTRAESDHTTATGDHTRAEADHAQAVTDSQQAATDHQQAESDAAAAAQDREKAAADRTKAADDRQQAAADHATAAQDHATASSDHQQAQSDHSTASADHTKATQDAERAASDHTRAGDDHDTAVADHQRAENDHARAESDHTTAAADHTTAASDHTQATEDHAVMDGYDTRLGNVEGDVSQLGQKVDECADADYRQSRTPAYIYRNLFDKTDPDIVDGYYVSHINGNLIANANYISSGFIPVIAGYDYYISYKSGIAWYDKDKAFISGSAASDTGNVQTAPNGAAFLRCTLTPSRLNDFIVAQSSVAVAYVPYGKIKASEIDGVLSDSNIPVTIARKEDAVLKKLGVNLFDQSAVTDRKILASDGTLSSGLAYETSDYIPVTAGESYYLSDTANILPSSAYVCFYDASKAFVSSVQSASGAAMAITIPSGCSYVRFSLTKANIRKPQFELGNARTKYFPYSIIGGYVPQIADETVYSESIVPGAITSDKVVDKAIGIKQTSIVFSVNMLDKEDADVATGKYVGPTDGTLRNNAGYNTSGFIGVFPGKTYYFGSLGNTVSPAQYALYDSTKVFVTGGNGVSSITIPAGCYYIRFTLTTKQWGNESAQMTLGSVLPYSVYEIVLDPSIGLGTLVKKFDSSLGNAAHTLTKSTLTDGETLTDYVFPRFQLKGLVMSFACKISTMGTLIVGKGYQQRLGQYLSINSTTVEFIRCNITGTESVRDTATHGLTIADFLRVSMYYIGNGYLRYIISTSSGYFQKDVNWYYYGEYDPFVKSTGTSASDVKLSIGSRDLKKPIWCFGDSNQSVSDNRWPGVLRNIGCFEFMINALTGINSVNALADAVRAFSFGTPKFAFWGLGGNDASDTDASTPTENWLTSVQSFIDLCKANGTIPILSTIACTPSKNHEGKNAWVRASGYRYIDIADAVGGNTFTSGVDTWYSGMMSDDEVHPTELGAQAMASRVLADLPEIMQQNQDIDYIS